MEHVNVHVSSRTVVKYSINFPKSTLNMNMPWDIPLGGIWKEWQGQKEVNHYFYLTEGGSLA